jgi:hypothetical protein
MGGDGYVGGENGAQKLSSLSKKKKRKQEENRVRSSGVRRVVAPV